MVMADVIPIRGEPDALLLRARLPLNDAGNARRFAEAARGHLLFCGELGRGGAWLWFDGSRWSGHDGDARARSVAIEVSAGLLDESRAMRHADEGEIAAVFGPKFTREHAEDRAAALFGWSMKSGNSDRTSGMIRQAAALVDDGGAFAMRASLDAFDVDPMAYHCGNGTLRFVEEGGRWTVYFDAGHRAADMVMRMAAVDYDENADCPRWLERLVMLHDDPAARTAIQRIMGMTLTGLISDQAFYIFQGKGNDGKSMTNKIVSALHGDYFMAASPKTFLASKAERSGSEHQADIVRLRGDVRMVVIDEPKKGSTWDGERIKQVTGSRITARAPNAVEDVSFTPRFKLIAECNTLPRAPSDDRGFRRRFKLLPWLKSFGTSDALVDEAAHIVEARLMAELPGILNWMITGALDWLNSGEVPEPSIASLAMSSYWAEGSPISEWIEERCDMSDARADCGATDLYQDFTAWCTSHGVKADAVMSQRAFGTALNERQIYAVKTHGRKVRRGVKLRGGAAVNTDPWPDQAGWTDDDL